MTSTSDLPPVVPNPPSNTVPNKGPNDPQKVGWQTTEFWAAAATAFGALVASFADALPPKWAAGISVVASAAYGLSRGLTKMNAS